VSEVLARYPKLLDVFTDLSPNFRHLRNPVMRRVQAPLVTVAQAARIAEVEPAILVRRLNAAAGLVAPAEELAVEEVGTQSPTVSMDGPVAEEIDARPLLARGEEPFKAIMAAAGRVPPGQGIRLLVPFEPVPQYDVLGKRGFTHATRQLGPNHWEVLFVRGDGAAPVSPELGPEPASPAAAQPEELDDVLIRIDVSDLVPPEPMVRILDAASRLRPGQTLFVEHVRRPVYLYPQLEAQGYTHETEEPEPGRVYIRIRRKEGGGS
jgi:uncharacterized protein (DUF2249 family)